MPWQEFYETTLKALQEAKNDRLWFKTNLKLGKLWFDMQARTPATPHPHHAAPAPRLALLPSLASRAPYHASPPHTPL